MDNNIEGTCWPPQDPISTSLTSIQKNNEKTKLYPVPSTGTIYLEVTPSSKKPVMIAITNMVGVYVFQNYYSNYSGEVIELFLHELPKGIYTLSVKFEDKPEYHKFILQ